MLLDFDGTLVELADDPDLVRLSDARRDLLRRLARRPDLTIGVISGRRLADLRRRVDAGSAVFYAGLHGLEIEGPGTRFVHVRAAGTRALIRRLGRSLVTATRDLADVRIEDKAFTVAMHVRGAAPTARRHAKGRLLEIAGPHLEAGTLRVLRGANVFEILPAVAWTKGDAVLHIKAAVARRYRRPVWPVYAGDDVTDEDAFTAIGIEGLAVAVGDRPTRAAFRLAGPEAVERLLRRVARNGS
jgi:alpha,alpha-trehalase